MTNYIVGWYQRCLLIMFHADGERIFFMDRIISSFLEHLIVEKGFSRNTSDAYRNDLSQFWEFLQNHYTNYSNGNGTESSSGDQIWRTVDIDVLNKYIEDLRIRKGYRDTTTCLLYTSDAADE